MMNAHELKQAQVRRTKLAAEIERIDNEIKDLQKIRKDKHNTFVRLGKEIQDAGKSPRITEHALLRYIERVKGIDLKAIEAEIFTPARIKVIKEVKNCNICTKDATIVVKDMMVVTVE